MSPLRIRRPIFDPSEVVAIATSDLHISLKCPIAREEEKSWPRAMDRPIRQIKSLARRYRVPVLCAGDVFDKPVVSPETINWALDHLPHLYAIPGNHDLPSHRKEAEHQSAFGTLVRAGRITPLGPKPLFIGELALYGRPFDGGVPKRVRTPADDLGAILHVLLTHEFIWTKGTGYQGAPEDRKLTGELAHLFRRFDVVVVGDNHHGFIRKLPSGGWLVNCGTPLRRKSSEADYHPRVGLILRSGEVVPHSLNIRRDLLTRTVSPKDEEEDEEIAELMEELEKLEKVQPESFSFREALLRALDRKKATKQVREVTLEALE